MKRCTRCHEVKPLDQFGPGRPGRLQSWCRACHNEWKRQANAGRGRRQTAAPYDRALSRLRALYPEEFELLYAEELAKAGVERQRPGRKARVA